MTKNYLFSQDIIKEIQTSSAIIRKQQSGIISLHHPFGVSDLGLEQFKENFTVVQEIQNGAKTPFLLNTGQVYKISNEAKQYLSKKVAEFASHMAMVPGSSNPLSQLSVRMYLYLHRPPIETRVFRDDRKAMIWLIEQLL